jgi:YidC/Oxa1 family membrane protein insertase
VIVAGILSPIERVLTWLLEHLHTDLALSWGWSVIVLTVIVRVLLVPVMVRQVHSMQNMQRHAPEMKVIQQKYKHDRRKQNEELMKFYKEHNINPASSCLPIVFQIPIFISLYFVLRDFEKEVFPKYPASDLNWLMVSNITDGITEHWSGLLLLTIYVGSQVASGYFMAVTAQRSQRILMMVVPFVILPFLLNPPGKTVFPVGLLMYWMTTNLWTIGQGLITRRTTPKAAPSTGPKRTSRTPPREEPPDAGDGAKQKQPEPKPSPAAAKPGPPRKVRRKKKRARR